MCYKLKIVFLILIVFSIKGIESITGNLQIWPIKKANKKKKQTNKQTKKKQSYYKVSEYLAESKT